jgi:cold shock CspA family protein
METGFVKFFDSRDNKRFGFITVDGGGEIFFHFNDGRNLRPGETEPYFGEGLPSADPRKDQRVVFNRSSNKKGDKASPWGFAEDYDRAKEKIAKRPQPKVYRVLKQTQVSGNSADEPQVLWEGSDIAKLSQKYPRTRDRRIDDLYPTFSCGDFSHTIWFECKTSDKWERIEDPRPEEGYAPSRRNRW